MKETGSPKADVQMKSTIEAEVNSKDHRAQREAIVQPLALARG